MGVSLQVILAPSLRIWPLAVFAAMTVVPATAEEPTVALERARAARRSGNLDAAAAVLVESIGALGANASQRAGVSLHRELGEVLFDQKQGERAAQEFETALRYAPGRAVLHYQAGLAYRMAGREPVAAGHLRQAVELGFRNTGALLHLAGAEFASGRLSGGLDASRRLLALQPESTGAHLRVGRLLFEQFFYADALRAFDAALAMAPDSYEARHFAALTNHLLNRPAAAVSLLAGLDQARVTAESSSLLASALALGGSESEAETLLLETIGRWPDSPHAYLNLSFLLLDRGRIEDAEKRLDELRGLAAATSPKVFYSVRRDPCLDGPDSGRIGDRPATRDGDRARAYFALASDLASRQHHRTAVALLDLSGRHGGDSARVLEAKAFSCLHVNPGDQGVIALLERLVAMVPDRARPHYLLGRAHMYQGRQEAAVASYRMAVALDPEDSRFHVELGRAHAAGARDADRRDAVKSLARAVELGSRNAVARYELGKLLSSMGRLDEAIKMLEESIAIEPELYNAYYVLGMICLRAGRRGEADRYLAMFEHSRAVAQARATGDAGFASGS